MVWFFRLLSSLFGQQNQENSPIERGKTHKKLRHYKYAPICFRRRHIIMWIIESLLIVAFLFSVGSLINYGSSYVASKRASDELRMAYHEQRQEEQSMTNQPSATPDISPTPSPFFTATPEALQTPLATATPAEWLAAMSYPGNAYPIISSRFQKIRRQNEDIIGWLTIEEIVDEAVVQRDNSYYLKRDYRGYHNVNGAIFLDESTDLRTRPYTLMLYGHNMKTGLMFGGLRNYENLTFYKNNPFITFDTMYEDGRYVVFSVAQVSTKSSNWRYMNWSWLLSSSVSLRRKAMNTLFQFSVYGKYIDVKPEDQILLLITCVDEEDERRVIAARRIRPDETEEELLKLVKKTRKK